MKILTLVGTRPELIRLAVIIQKLNQLPIKHVVVYTNQNYDPNLSDIFFRDLGITVDYLFPKTQGLGDFLGSGFREFEMVLNVEKPDKVLVLGDTNSGLLAILAAKKGIPVYHMEAGNRCYDGAVPEETNRRVIDACSYMNLPYTQNSKENLVNEGFHKNNVFKIGNPINEVLLHYAPRIEKSEILSKLGLLPHEWPGISDPAIPYALLTLHRTENVDCPYVVGQVIGAMNKIAEKMPIVFPLHPRTKDQFAKQGIKLSDKIIVTEPLGFFDFVQLERNATVVFTDSGTVPEETSLFEVPCIVLRNTTERQELMESGLFILAGTKEEDIMRAFTCITAPAIMQERFVNTLEDYVKNDVSDTVVKMLIGQNHSIIRKGHDEY